jgi:transcriptional antiterminator RfaH
MRSIRNAKHPALLEHAADERWYCVHTTFARETTAAEYLRSKHVPVYNPMLPARGPRTGRMRAQPLFPRYLFARFAVGRDFETVRYGRGIVSVVSDMEGPLPVADAVIDDIRQNLESGGYSQVLVAGEKVQVGSGAFEGLTGIFHAYASGQERVRILMDLMNRPVMVELPVSEVEKLSSQPAPGAYRRRAF